jgi:hypothetical protein
MQPLSLFQALVGTALIGTTFGAAVPQEPNASLWQPAVGSTYQIILTNVLSLAGGLTPDVDIYDIDLFDTDASIIQGLHAKGKKVICYFSGWCPQGYDSSTQG